MTGEKIDSLKWMRRQLELWPGEDCKTMASLTGEVIDYLEDATFDMCYLTIPEAEESAQIDDNTAFIVYLGKTEGDNDLTMLWEPADGLHLQEVYGDKLKQEITIAPERAAILLKALKFILPPEPEA